MRMLLLLVNCAKLLGSHQALGELLEKTPPSEADGVVTSLGSADLEEHLVDPPPSESTPNKCILPDFVSSLPQSPCGFSFGCINLPHHKNRVLRREAIGNSRSVATHIPRDFLTRAEQGWVQQLGQ